MKFIVKSKIVFNIDEDVRLIDIKIIKNLKNVVIENSKNVNIENSKNKLSTNINKIKVKIIINNIIR